MSSSAVAKSSVPASPVQILTVDEVAAWLRMTRRQIYEMTRTRGKVRASDPIPVVRINGNVRFVKSEIEAWINRLAECSAEQ